VTFTQAFAAASTFSRLVRRKAKIIVRSSLDISDLRA
jgi:hypothetical protein